MTTLDSDKELLLRKYNFCFDQVMQTPNEPHSLMHLADTCLSLGKRKEALLFYRKAFNLNPTLEELATKLKSNFTPEELKDIEFPDKVLSFWPNLVAVAKYPLAKQGFTTIILGALFIGIFSTVASFNPLPVLPALIVMVVYMYFMAYPANVLMSSAIGKKELPDWPMAIIEEIVRPIFQLFVAGFVSAIPMIFTLFLAFLSGTLGAVFTYVMDVRINSMVPKSFQVPLVVPSIPSFLMIWFFVSLLVAFIYFPMAMLVVIMHNNAWMAIDFPITFRSIKAIKKQYFLSLLSMAIFAIIGLLLTMITSFIPLLNIVLFWLIVLYITIVEMRVLGNFYYVNRRELKWF